MEVLFQRLEMRGLINFQTIYIFFPHYFADVLSYEKKNIKLTILTFFKCIVQLFLSVK